MDKPDKIWAWPTDIEGGYMAASHVGEPPIPEYTGFQTEYLLATPERELASELVAIARKSLTYHSDEAEYQDELCCDEGAAYHKRRVKEISAVLAKLEGKG